MTLRHRLIVIYKTAYYSFYLPVALAFHMSKVPMSYRIPSSPTPIEPYKLALDILIPLGEYFQTQDDFLDYAGTPEQIGKVGTDIIDNKCSWCINTALALASSQQHKVLDENYGQKDAEKEVKVSGQHSHTIYRYLASTVKIRSGSVRELGFSVLLSGEVDGGPIAEYVSTLTAIFPPSILTAGA